MEVNLLVLICFILFLIFAKKYLMPQVLKSGKIIVEDTGTWKDITGFFKDPKFKFKIIITLVLLIIYIIGTNILLPGIDLDIQSNDQSGLLIKVFYLKSVSVFALGVMPLISANGLLLLSAIAVPSLRRFSRSSQRSIRRINQFVYLLTLIICIVQGYGLSKSFESLGIAQGEL